MGCACSVNKNSKSDPSECSISKDIDYTTAVTFVPPVDSGYVIKVYDGDTITIASKLPYASSLLYKFSVRLNGIDCPEIKGKTEEEKTYAKMAKELLSNKILGQTVYLKNVKTEKYGRILADVYTKNNLHLNQFMIDNKLAVEYSGGTKEVNFSWKNYYNK